MGKDQVSTPLNEEALEVAARATYEMRNPESWARDWEELGAEEREEEWVKPARAAVSAYLSAVPADTVNSVEELDALPVGSLILDNMREVGKVRKKSVYFVDSDELHPKKLVAELFLPATVLYRPEANDGR